MKHEVKSEYIKNKIKNHSFKDVLHRYYIERLIYLEDYIMNKPFKPERNVLVDNWKAKYSDDYKEIFKELKPEEYKKNTKEILKEISEKILEHKKEEKEWEQEEEELKKVWLSVGGVE